MSILLSFLGTNWRWVLPALIILGLVARIGVLNNESKHKDEIIGGLQQTIGALGNQITVQNNAVNALQNAVNNRQKALDSSSQLANELQKKHNDLANTIENNRKSLDEKIVDLSSCQKQLGDLHDYMTQFEADHKDKLGD